MKKILGMLLGISCLWNAHSAEIKFLETYDQLSNVIGQEGHWFVRDAAGTASGQHGDPTVLKGWAIYTWNNRVASTGTGGWTKICEEESLDHTTAEVLTKEFARKEDVAAQISEVKSTYTSLVKHATDLAAVQSLITALDVRITTVEEDVTDLKTTSATQQRKITQLTDEIVMHENWAVAMSNNVLTSAKAYADSKIGGVTKEYVDTNIAGVSNNVISIAGADATRKATDAITTAQQYTDATRTGLQNNITTVSNQVTTLNSRVGAVETRVAEVQTFAESASNNVLVAAKNYADLKDASVSNNVLKLAKDYTDSKAIGTDTNAVLDIIQTQKSNYATNIADSARSYTDLTIGRKKFQLSTTNNFNVTEWRGIMVWREYEKEDETSEPVLTYCDTNEVKFVWKGNWYQDKWNEETSEYDQIPVTNVWTTLVNDGGWSDWCYCVSGKCDTVTGKYTFWYDYDLEDGRLISWEGWHFKHTEKFEYNDGLNVNYCDFDIEAVIPDETVDDYIATRKELEVKRNITDYVVPAYKFEPDDSINFGCTNFVGTIPSFDFSQKKMIYVPTKAVWTEELSYWDSEESETVSVPNVWQIYIIPPTSEVSWSDTSMYLKIVKNETNAYDVIGVDYSEKTNYNWVVSDIRDMQLPILVEVLEGYAPTNGALMAASTTNITECVRLKSDMGDHAADRLVFASELTSKRDVDDFVVSQTPNLSTALPFNITNWTGTVHSEFDDQSVDYPLRAIWDDSNSRWTLQFSENGGLTWNNMYNSYITGLYTNECHLFAVKWFGEDAFDFSGLTVETNITNYGQTYAIVLTAQPLMIVTDRIMRLSDMGEFAKTNEIVSTNVLINALKGYATTNQLERFVSTNVLEKYVTTNKLDATLVNYATKKDIQDMGGGKVSDLFFSPISTTNENFGVTAWTGYMYAKKDQESIMELYIPLRADWDTTNKVWNLMMNYNDQLIDTELVITGRYDQVNKNFVFNLTRKDGSLNDCSTWNNFYCDVAYPTFFGDLPVNCMVHLEPENTKGERLQTDRDVLNKRNYDDLTFDLDGFEPDPLEKNFGIEYWDIVSSINAGSTNKFIAVWTTNETTVGSVSVCDCWVISNITTQALGGYIKGQRTALEGEYNFIATLIDDDGEVSFDWTGFIGEYKLYGMTVMSILPNGYSRVKLSSELLTSDDIVNKRDYTDLSVKTGDFVFGTNGNFGIEKWTGEIGMHEGNIGYSFKVRAQWSDAFTLNNFTTNNCWIVYIDELDFVNDTYGIIVGNYDDVSQTYKFDFIVFETMHHQQPTDYYETTATNLFSFSSFHGGVKFVETTATETITQHLTIDAVVPKYASHDRLATENYIEPAITNAYRSEERWKVLSQVTLPSRETATIRELWDVINTLVGIAQSKPDVPIKSDYAILLGDITSWDFIANAGAWNSTLQLKSSDCWETAVAQDSLIYQLKRVDNQLNLNAGTYSNETTFVTSVAFGSASLHNPIGAPYVFYGAVGNGASNTVIQISAPYKRFK